MEYPNQPMDPQRSCVMETFHALPQSLQPTKLSSQDMSLINTPCKQESIAFQKGHQNISFPSHTSGEGSPEKVTRDTLEN